MKSSNSPTNKEAYLQEKLRDAWQRGRSAEDTANALRLMKAYVELRFEQFTIGNTNGNTYGKRRIK